MTPPALRVSDAERRQLTERLKQAAVEGRITLEEFGERAELAVKARTAGELEALVEDLPAYGGAGAGVGSAMAMSGTTAGAAMARPAVASTVAILSSAERTGAWRVGERTRVIAVMGSCKLDLRRAAISAPVTVIRANVVMGNLNVIVPDGVEVDLTATTVMGSRTARLSGPPPAAGAPLVVIEGLVVMGDVTVRDKPEHGQ